VPVVEAGWSERRTVAEYGTLLQRLAAKGFEFRRRGSGALGLAEVAAGRNDGYVELHMNAWDALAGLLLAAEAGGRCNDFLADGGLTEGNLTVAATPEIWDGLMQAACLS
jgi:myo-inositol-1(or 4)-monophosphatase